MIYVATECVIGHGYNATNDHNLYRVSRDSHFEYLDVTEPESVQALHQAVRHLLLQIYQGNCNFLLVGGPNRETVRDCGNHEKRPLAIPDEGHCRNWRI